MWTTKTGIIVLCCVAGSCAYPSFFSWSRSSETTTPPPSTTTLAQNSRETGGRAIEIADIDTVDKGTTSPQEEDGGWRKYLYSLFGGESRVAAELDKDDGNSSNVESSWNFPRPEFLRMMRDAYEQYSRNISICTPKDFLCPNLRDNFQGKVCCSSPWLEQGAYLGLGGECWVELKDMEEQCDILDCYKQKTGTWNTDGCTYIPDSILNTEACDMHDLCYVTPGVTKEECDSVMEENINKIYCENVREEDQARCYVKSTMAAYAKRALDYTDSYFRSSQETRQQCKIKDNLLTRALKFSKRAIGVKWFTANSLLPSSVQNII